MCYKRRPDAPCPNIYKRREPPKDGCVCELEQGADDAEGEAVRVVEREFVEMVEVCDTEVEGGCPDDGGGGVPADEVERDDAGAEDDFFGEGALLRDQLCKVAFEDKSCV